MNHSFLWFPVLFLYIFLMAYVIVEFLIPGIRAKKEVWKKKSVVLGEI